MYNKQITKIFFILDNQRWRLKDDDTLENIEGILDGAPTWNMPDTKWAFIHSAKDEEKFLIRNTKLKKYLHVEEMKKGELVNADAEEGKTLFNAAFNPECASLVINVKPCNPLSTKLSKKFLQ